MTRREFLIATGGVAATGGLVALDPQWRRRELDPHLLNDAHSHLNQTRVASVAHPASLQDAMWTVKRARREGKAICPSGSRHAMGGQQFLAQGQIIDTRSMNKVLDFDSDRGLVDVEVGIEWPALVAELLRRQEGEHEQWTIPMKQTGADNLTLGGAISANAHGRTLTRPPIVADIESVLLIGPSGDPIRCSRTENQELFSLVHGGYGLFGLMHSATLRLAKRQKIQRHVKLLPIAELTEAFEERVDQGYETGDFQFVTDENAPDFLTRGVFSCYRPVPLDTPIPGNQGSISSRAWNELVYLAHTNKAKAFQLYSDYYLKTDGQVYWADTSQLGGYAFDYHQVLDRRMRSAHPGSEMITELYVPRAKLADFMGAAAREMRERRASVIYGTVRLIEKDTESYLAWAKESYACVIFNLHVDHHAAGVAKAAEDFRALIYLAIERGGSYYLTYHRWARPDQVLACYPNFPSFLKKKLAYDPQEVFQSDWYKHYRQMFAREMASP